MTTSQTRLLTRHDRFCVARERIGHSPILVFLFAYASPSSVPSREALVGRMQAIAGHYPIFSASVKDHTTSKQRFETRIFSEDEIANRVHDRGTSFDANATSQERMQHLFGEELRSARVSFDYESARLWQITRILPEAHEGESYVAITYHHVILDGMGGLRFAQMLLAPSTNTESADSNTGKLPAALDDTVNVKPGYLHLASVIFNELLLPALPKWLVPASLRPTVAWPNDLGATDSARPAISHSQATNEFLVISLSEDLVSGLRQAGAANGALGVHAIVTAAAMVALSQTGDQTDGFKIVTPMSERQPELGHPHTGGNYVAAADYSQRLASSSDFWQIARAYADFLKSPRTRAIAREQWGLLDLLPEVPADNPKQQTSYDKFLLDKADSASPYGSSFEVSNPGFIELPASSAIQRAAWIQPGACTGSAFSINVIGYGSEKSKSAMTLTLSWLEDTAPQGRLSKEQMQSFQRSYVKALEAIAGRQTKGSLSVGELQKAIGSA